MSALRKEPGAMPGRRVDGVNKYGTPITRMVCAACGSEFTVCPAIDPAAFGPYCLGDNCPSYDIERDPTYLFAPSDPELIEP